MFEAVKGMGELIKSVHDASLKSKMLQTILDVQADCFALNEKLSEYQRENASLNSEIGKLKACVEKGKQISISSGCHYIHDRHGSRPICGNCYESKGFTITLFKSGEEHVYGVCPTCNTGYDHAFTA